MSSPVQRRSYDSSGRRAQAQANRARIIDAARELFVQRGFAGTPVADIAEAAGVSVPTVFARFGSKTALLKDCVDTATVGDVEPVPLAERPEMLHVRAGTTARQVLSRLATLIATAGPRVVPIYMVMYAAADSDPEITAMARDMDAQRLAGATSLATLVLERLGSDDPRHLAEVRDLIWTVNSPQTFSLLVTERGWPTERYEAWARRTLLGALRPLRS